MLKLVMIMNFNLLFFARELLATGTFYSLFMHIYMGTYTTGLMNFHFYGRELAQLVEQQSVTDRRLGVECVGTWVQILFIPNSILERQA